MIAETLSISKTTVCNNLCMWEVCVKFVLKLLADDPKINRVAIASDLWNRVQNQ